MIILWCATNLDHNSLEHKKRFIDKVKKTLVECYALSVYDQKCLVRFPSSRLQCEITKIIRKNKNNLNGINLVWYDDIWPTKIMSWRLKTFQRDWAKCWYCNRERTILAENWMKFSSLLSCPQHQ